jgi:hypothetical protein
LRAHIALPFVLPAALHIIGYLCHFVEIGRIFTSVSQKKTILAVPVQARQPITRNRRRDALAQTPQKKLSAICNLSGSGRDVRRTARPKRGPDTTTNGLPTGFCLSERTT